MASEPTIIVEVIVPARQVMQFQNLLEAEEGLAVMRCFDPERIKQQLWTTPTQLDDLLEWIATVPNSIDCKIVGQWQQ